MQNVRILCSNPTLEVTMLSLLQGHVAMIYGVVSVFISPVTTKPGQDGKSGGTHLTLHMIMM